MKSLVQKLVLVFAALVACASAAAQWSPPPPLETIDLPAANAKSIVTGTVVSYKVSNEDSPYFDVEFAVRETLKGEQVKQLQFTEWMPDAKRKLSEWKEKGSLLLVTIGPPHGPWPTIIDLTDPNLAVFTADLKLLRKPEEVIQAIKDRVPKRKDAPQVPIFTRNFPVKLIEGTPLEKTTYVDHHKNIRINVPVDERLEKFGRDLTEEKEPQKRLEGILVLSYFKDRATIERLKEMLKDDAWRSTSHYTDNRLYVLQVNEIRQAAFQRLQDLGVITAEPETTIPKDRNMQVTSADASDTPTKEEVSDLASCVNLVDYSLAGAKLDNGILDAVARLRSLKMLYLQGSSITDEGLLHLATLPKLEYICLGGTSTSDKGLLNVARIKSLKRVDASPFCTPRGISALKRIRPDIVVQPDEFAFLAKFYPQRIEMGFRGRSVHPATGPTPEVWRYGLLFGKQDAEKVDEFLVKECSSSGWKPGGEDTANGYHRLRHLNSFKGEYLDIVMAPNESGAWGVSSESGGRFVIIERMVRSSG